MNILNLHHRNKRGRFLLLSGLLASIAMLCACNEKGDDTTTYIASPSVAVNNFELCADAKVLSNLDSVFFSIDLDHGVIFNADSLPMGTDVRALSANISFPSSVTSAIVEMTGGTHRTGSFDYKANTTDTIDFTGNVTLTLNADDGLSKKYRLKVNVHKSNPDSLHWCDVSYRTFPNLLNNASEQKTLEFKGKVYTFSRNDNVYFMHTTTNPLGDSWSGGVMLHPFKPANLNDHSVAATTNTIFMLSSDNRLYRSLNGVDWKYVCNNVTALIGSYGDRLLALSKHSDGKYYHLDVLPDYSITETDLEEDFPVKGFSNCYTVTSKWSGQPTVFICGGISTDGKFQNSTWGYDGNQWTVISSSNTLPKISGAGIIPYFIYRKTTSVWVQTEYSISLAIGGVLADGTPNRTVYMSYDNGVNWGKAPAGMQLPDFMPTFNGADYILAYKPMTADVSDAWTKSRRLPYHTDGYNISWDCPYILIFGGLDSKNVLNQNLWSAVLARLTFAPLF